jgi:hypothetical protein
MFSLKIGFSKYWAYSNFRIRKVVEMKALIAKQGNRTGTESRAALYPKGASTTEKHVLSLG